MADSHLEGGFQGRADQPPILMKSHTFGPRYPDQPLTFVYPGKLLSKQADLISIPHHSDYVDILPLLHARFQARSRVKALSKTMAIYCRIATVNDSTRVLLDTDKWRAAKSLLLAMTADRRGSLQDHQSLSPMAPLLYDVFTYTVLSTTIAALRVLPVLVTHCIVSSSNPAAFPEYWEQALKEQSCVSIVSQAQRLSNRLYCAPEVFSMIPREGSDPDFDFDLVHQKTGIARRVPGDRYFFVKAYACSESAVMVTTDGDEAEALDGRHNGLLSHASGTWSRSSGVCTDSVLHHTPGAARRDFVCHDGYSDESSKLPASTI
ncbi:hypothetical protein DOTSEDRAFT_32115 [Dothistroma septosporum NZE10]|uniref:Uncharacterized protein n=1 Tax=Dothistroma septosporum (strain NZE10 / CBS 128990) TaxID=675120 RepID=N1PXL1_DOTSN|nr:hypothetical protein DOTSEDRAFT_32115 [Dothistroma septosporum NZE10]